MKFPIIAAIISLFCSVNIFGQDIPNSILPEGRLSSRSALLPYATKEAALEGKIERSDFIIPFSQWQTDTLTNGIRYTAKFKRNYKFDDTELILRVEGAGGAVGIDVNGRSAGYAPSGIGRNEFDLTKVLAPNNNEIAVTVYTSHPSQKIECGRIPDGSLRRAMLIASPRVAVSDFVINTSFNGDSGLLNFGVVMQSFLLNSKTYRIFFELLAPDGRTIANGNKELTTRMRSRDTVTFFARVPAVRKWSAASPDLYTLVVYTQHERRTKEFTSCRIGFRTVENKEGKLYINGSIALLAARPASFGKDAAATFENLTALKKSGANTVVVPSPQPEEFYDMCDQIGLYVCDQADIDCTGTAMQATPSNDPEWKDAYCHRNIDMYHSSKIHPSVVMFSMARNAQNGICLYESYLFMKALGDSRPMIYPEVDGQWNSDRVEGFKVP